MENKHILAFIKVYYKKMLFITVTIAHLQNTIVVGFGACFVVKRGYD